MATDPRLTKGGCRCCGANSTLASLLQRTGGRCCESCYLESRKQERTRLPTPTRASPKHWPQRSTCASTRPAFIPSEWPATPSSWRAVSRRNPRACAMCIGAHCSTIVGKIGIRMRCCSRRDRSTRPSGPSCARIRRRASAFWRQCRPSTKPPQIVLCHEERYDGSGYPAGLRGNEIPLGARLFAVIDTLDAMTSDRPYRRGVDFDTAESGD
jgi:hypothetical protein